MDRRGISFAHQGMGVCNTFNPQFSTGFPRPCHRSPTIYPRGLWRTGVSVVDPVPVAGLNGGVGAMDHELAGRMLPG
jgi:hypothetical protein